MSDRSYIAIGDSEYLKNEVQMKYKEKELRSETISNWRCMVRPVLLSVCIIFQIEINGFFKCSK